MLFFIFQKKVLLGNGGIYTVVFQPNQKINAVSLLHFYHLFIAIYNAINLRRNRILCLRPAKLRCLSQNYVNSR